jgi:hypothetical protein
VVSDERVNQLAGKERAAANQVPVGSALKVRRRAQLTRALRRTRNRPGGYWVAAADPQAASQAVTGTLPAKSLQRAVLLSDGASRLVDLFELATWEELLALLDENGSDELLRQVRAAEATDPEGRRWPRTKRSDDATAVAASAPPTNPAPEPSPLGSLIESGRLRWLYCLPLRSSRQATVSTVPRVQGQGRPPGQATGRGRTMTEAAVSHPLAISGLGGLGEGAVAVGDVGGLVIQLAADETVPQDLQPAVAEGPEGGVVGRAAAALGVVELPGPARVAQRANAHCWTASAR